MCSHHLPRLGLALLLVAVLTAGARPHAATADSGADLIAAAQARLVQSGAAVTPVRYEIVRVVQDYAVVRMIPPFGSTDPALILLQRQNGVWSAFAGPGTGFAPPDFPAGLPDNLLTFTSPYTGDDAQSGINLISQGRQTYKGAGYTAQILGNAATAPATGPSLGVPTGPETGWPEGTVAVTVSVPTTTPSAPSPRFYVRPPVSDSGVSLDVYGYDFMQKQIAFQMSMGAPNSTPLGASFYHTAFNDIFQIDWFGGDSTLTTFLIAPTGGGPVVQINASVYPFQNDPNAPLAQVALTLALQTLLIQP
jgi:hypothetical protein